MNKKLAIIAIACAISIVLGGYNSSILFGTQYLGTKEGYSYTVGEAASWWDCNWSYAKKITIDHTKVQSDQTNFPVLLYESTDSDLASYAQEDGGDIVFVDSFNLTQYDHELEKYVSSTGEMVAWVEVASLSSTADTILYMYYGNPSCSNQWDVNGTWNSGYSMVQHLDESSGSHEDSTSNNNDGTVSGTVTQGTTGKSQLDGSDYFSDGTGYINFGNASSLASSSITVEGWVKDPPIHRMNREKNMVQIVDKHEEQLPIIPGRSFAIERMITGDSEVVFAALCSPGVTLKDMVVDGESVFEGMYNAASPKSTVEKTIEPHRVLLPHKLQGLPFIGYTQPFTVQGNVTITMEFIANQMGYSKQSGRISYLVFSEDTMDFEATTHWSNMFSWKAWDPFSAIFRFVNRLINGERKPPLKLPAELDAAFVQGESVRVMISLDKDGSFKDQSAFLRDAGFVTTTEIASQKVVAGYMDKDVFDQIKTNQAIAGIYVDELFDVLLEESLPLIRYNETVQEFGLTGNGSTICILDTGVDPTVVPYSYGYDFVNDDSDPFDDHGHGTQVASVIHHIAPEATLIVAKVLDENGVGYASDVLAGLEYCMDQNPDIISFSIGSIVGCSGFCDTDMVTGLCNEAVSQGIFVVAATGNDGSTNLVSPACGSLVFSVGATDDSDGIASFSNVNPTLDVFAPGVDITTIVGTLSGTSMSVPHVTGAAALVLQHEVLSPELLKYRFRSTGVPIHYVYNENIELDIARVDLYNAVVNEKTMEPYDYSWWWQGNIPLVSPVYKSAADPPSSFTAATYNETQINLSWTKGNEADYTRIQRKTGSYPTSISDGTNVYNNTGTSHNNDGLSENTTYYYRAWSWNTTDSVWSTSNSNASNTTSSVKPTITWEYPTPDDGNTTTNNWVCLNTTITDESNTSAFFDWNRSLVGYWAMDFYNSTGIYDNSTYDNFGTFQGGLGTGDVVDGKYGKGVDFDGSNDYVEVAHNTSLDPAQLTVEVWLYQRGRNALLRDTYVCKTNAAYTEVYSLFDMDADHSLNPYPFDMTGFGMTIGGTDYGAVITSYLPLNTWHHLVGTCNGSTMNFYVNGVLRDTATGVPARGTTTGPLTIGVAECAGVPPYHFYFVNGTIDEVKIFSRALSPEEINASYNNGLYRLYHNFTSLSDGTHNYSAYAIDEAGNLNITSEREITTVTATLPTVTTNTSTGVEETNATLHGYLSDDGYKTTACGFWYDTVSGGTSNNQSVGTVSEGNTFSYNATLSAGQLYFFKAWAKNSVGFNGTANEKTFLTKPNVTTSFTATAYNETQIDLSWSAGDGANNTYVEYNASASSWLRGQGTEIYNSTGASYSHTGLTENTTYYYQAWSFTTWTYNPTLNQWSDTNASDNATSTSVKPEISWIYPTPDDGNTTTNNWVYLNTTISDASNTSAFFDWNRSLVGYWAMDFYNSTGIYDNSTYDNFGTFNGGQSTSDITTGKYGDALKFDGSNDYVDCGNDSSTDFNSDEDFTLEAWINPTSNTTAGAIISKENNKEDGYNLIYTKNKTIAFIVGGRLVDELKLSLDANNLNSYSGSGSTWTDLSGGSNDGTIYTNVTWETDSFVFINTEDYPGENIGNDGYVIWGYREDLYETANVTIEVLAKYNNGGNGNDGTIWRCDDWTRTELKLTSGGDITWTVGYSTGSDTLNYDLNLAEETWVHIIVTHKNDTEQKIYINGVEVASRTPDAYNFGGTSNNPNIGRGHGSIYSAPFRGNIAEFQLYHKTLSSEEIKQNYRSVAYRMSLANNATTTDTVPLNEYTHVVAKKQGTTCSIYLNGVLSKPFTCNLTQNLTGTLQIGKRVSGVREYFNGTIDEVRIYNRALSPQEINASYNNSVYRLYHNFTGLADGTHNYSAYAIDAAGNLNITSEREITTVTATIPTVTTNTSTGVEETNATLHGYLSDDGYKTTTCGFWYDTTSGGTSNNQSVGTVSEGNTFSYNATLSAGQLYFFKAWASNSVGFNGTANEMTFLSKPNVTTSFTATAVNETKIDLSWSAGDGANNTYIEYNTVSSWERGSGAEIYNSTGSSYSHTGLSENTTYYYQAWSFTTWTYNPTLNQWSDTNASDNATSTSVKPEISWIYPTPDDGNTTTNNWVYLNTTITDASNTSAFFDWNKSLAGYWNFEEDSGSTAYDSSTYGNNGILTGFSCLTLDCSTTSGRVSWGQFGNAVRMDTSGDCVSVGNAPSLAINGSLTIEAWLKINTSSTPPAVTHFIAGNWEDTGDKRAYALWFWGGTWRKPTFALMPTGTWDDAYKLEGSTSLSLNEWNHIVGVYNGTTMTVYLNGNNDGSTAGPSEVYIGSVNFSIGAYEASYFCQNCAIDEVRVHNRSLNPEEINASYNNGLYRLYHNFTGLSDGTYNYSAYAIDAAGNLNITTERTITVSTNNAPVLSNPGPSNGSTCISTTPTLNVTVDDADDDTLTATWYSNSSGSWVLFATNSNIDTSSGAVNISQTNSNFSGYDTTYWWSVNLTDSVLWTNRTYHFTTKDEPTRWLRNPDNGSTGVSRQPTVWLQINTSCGYTTNVYFSENITGSWVIRQTNTSVGSNSSVNWTYTQASSYNTTYWYRVNVSSSPNVSSIYHFTTEMPITVVTNESTGVEETNATLHGYLQYDGGGSCTVRFEYGSNTTYGTNTTNQAKTGGNTFSAGISGLTKGQLYRYRAYGNNTVGSDLGSDNAFLTKPDPPSSFVATVYDNTRINLTWTVGTGANLTDIERHTTETWGKGDGTEIYNDSGTSYQDTGLSPGIQYFYRAWSYTTWTYNPTLHQWSDSNTSAGTNTTAKNKNIFNMSRGTYSLEMDTNATTLYGYIKSTAITAPIDTEWHHVALTYDGTTARLYKDGISVNSTAIGGSITYPGTIPDLSAGLYLTGYLDELRISSSARSASWISTSYQNTNSPTTFATFGSAVGVLSTWIYRKRITINSNLVDSDLANFPVLVYNASDSDLKNNALSSGNDIIFLDSSASENWKTETWRSKLDHEIEKYDSSTGELVAWVRLPTLSSTTDTEIYMYYGNTICTSNRQNIEGVWDSNHVLVQHLNETPANDVEGHLDSTSNDNDGAPKDFNGTSNSTTDATGKIDGADMFDGDNDYVEVAHNTSLDTAQLTVEVWLYQRGRNALLRDTYVCKTNAAYTEVYSLFDMDADHSLNPYPFDMTGFGMTIGGTDYGAVITSYLPLDTWYHLVGTCNGSTMNFYVNGVLRDTATGVPARGTTTGPLTIGVAECAGVPPYYFYFVNGTIDEVRISNIARNASWINATFNNANDSATYITFGSQEIKNEAPALSNPSPSDGATGQSLNPTLSITVNDTNIDQLNISFWTNASGSWQQLGGYHEGYNGTYPDSNATNMNTYGTTYYWSANVTDNVLWTNETYSFTTSVLPVLSNENPTNGSSGVSIWPACNVTVSDADGGTVDVYFYENTTGSWVLQQTNASVDVSSAANVIWGNFTNVSQPSTKYNWSVNVTDGTGWINETYSFTTLASPFIYIYDKGKYKKLSDFIPGATSPDKEYVHYTDITGKTDVIDGKVKLKITEELEETTYLDRLCLRVDDRRTIELDSIAIVTKDSSAGPSLYLKTAIDQSFSPEQFILSQINKILLKQSDNHYLIMKEGAEYYLEFIAPEGRYSKLEFVAEGYYIEHYKNI